MANETMIAGRGIVFWHWRGLVDNKVGIPGVPRSQMVRFRSPSGRLRVATLPSSMDFQLDDEVTLVHARGAEQGSGPLVGVVNVTRGTYLSMPRSSWFGFAPSTSPASRFLRLYGIPGAALLPLVLAWFAASHLLGIQVPLAVWAPAWALLAGVLWSVRAILERREAAADRAWKEMVGSHVRDVAKLAPMMQDARRAGIRVGRSPSKFLRGDMPLYGAFQRG